MRCSQKGGGAPYLPDVLSQPRKRSGKNGVVGNDVMHWGADGKVKRRWQAFPPSDTRTTLSLMLPANASSLRRRGEPSPSIGEHILLQASSPPGKPTGIYVTDRKGTPPKLILENAGERAGVSPDGAWIICQHEGKRLLQSTMRTESKEFPELPGRQRPIAWGSDEQHVFTQETETDGVNLGRLDLRTGKVEPGKLSGRKTGLVCGR